MVYLVEILLAYVQKMHYSLLTGISGSNFCTCKKKAEVISLTYRLDDHRLSLSLSLSRVPGGFSLCFVSSIIKTWNSSQDEIVFLSLGFLGTRFMVP
jgi:hypothetical protein